MAGSVVEKPLGWRIASKNQSRSGNQRGPDLPRNRKGHKARERERDFQLDVLLALVRVGVNMSSDVVADVRCVLHSRSKSRPQVPPIPQLFRANPVRRMATQVTNGLFDSFSDAVPDVGLSSPFGSFGLLAFMQAVLRPVLTKRTQLGA